MGTLQSTRYIAWVGTRPPLYAALIALWLSGSAGHVRAACLQEDEATIKVKVRDENGAPVVRPRVTLKKLGTKSPWTVYLDAEKQEYENIVVSAPGNYSVVACDGPAYSTSPVLKTGILRAGEEKAFPFSLKLNPNTRRISREIALTDEHGVPRKDLALRLYASGCETKKDKTDRQGRIAFTDLVESEEYEIIAELNEQLSTAFLIPKGGESAEAIQLELGEKDGQLALTQKGASIELAISSLPPMGRSYDLSVSLLGVSPGGLGSTRQSVIVTKSGTNGFHGKLEYRVMNDAFDARNPFNIAEFNTSRSHYGTFELGGPVVKDHLFFFSTYSLSRRAYAPTFSPVLVSQLPALNQQLQRLGFPAEDLRRFLTTQATDWPSIRLDYDLGSTPVNKQLSINYQFKRKRDLKQITEGPGGTAGAPSSARDSLDRTHFLGLQYLWDSSSSVSSTTSYRYRQVSISINPVEPLQTSILIPGIAILGRATDIVNGEGNSWTNHLLSESLQTNVGRHSLKVGGQFAFDEIRFRFAAFESGRAIISSIAALAAATPTAELFEIGRGGSQVSFGARSLDLHFLDDFKASSKLSFALGLKYKAEFPPDFVRKDINGLQPSIGVMWNPDGNGKTVLRGSYYLTRGRLPLLPIAFNLLMGGQGLGSDIPTPMRRVASFVGESTATVAFNQFLRGVVPDGPQLATTYNPSNRSPLIQSVGLTVQRELKRSMTLELAYQYTRSGNLLASTNTNLPPPTLINDRPDFADRAVNPAFAQIYQFLTTSTSSLHRGSVSTRGSIGRFNLNAVYSFSKTIDNLPTFSFEATPENVFNRDNDRAVADEHIGQSFDASVNMDILSPAKEYRSRLISSLRHFFLDGILRLNSGNFFNVLAGTDANHDGNPLTDRPLNVGRNTFLGQRFARLDLGIGARFKTPAIKALAESKENYSLELKVEFFNVFNRTNFDNYDTVLGRTDLTGLSPGVVSGRQGNSDFDFRHPLTPGGFGLATSASTPRRIQLGLRFTF